MPPYMPLQWTYLLDAIWGNMEKGKRKKVKNTREKRRKLENDVKEQHYPEPRKMEV
jgi:hypothetical protein